MRRSSWLASLRQLLHRPYRRGYCPGVAPLIATARSSEPLESRVCLSANAVNDGPFAVTEDTVSSNLNLLGNDSGDSIYLATVDTPTWGSVTINSDGTINYSADNCSDLPAGETRNDVFNYSIVDSDTNTSTATVTITITGVNDAPSAEDDDNGTMGPHDTIITISTSSILSNDSDPDYDTLTVSIVSATNGTAVINDNGTSSDTSDDFIEFTPNTNFVGTATITYQASDGTDDDSAVITLQVTNSAPSASDDSFSLSEDQQFDSDNVANVLSNDSDMEGDAMTVTLVSGPTDAANFTLNSDGTFDYKPISAWDGSDTFVYKASDGIATTLATVTITASSGNLVQVSSPNPAATPGTPVGPPIGTFSEGTLNDVVTIYDDQDQGYGAGTATSSHFSDAADFGTPIAAHDWANLVAALATYVVSNGQINQLVIFDHGSGSGQEIGNEIITPDMWADIKPLLSPTACVIRMAGCNVGSNATYCNDVATATGVTVEATSGFVLYRTRWFDYDYWAANGVWLTF